VRLFTSTATQAQADPYNYTNNLSYLAPLGARSRMPASSCYWISLLRCGQIRGSRTNCGLDEPDFRPTHGADAELHQQLDRDTHRGPGRAGLCANRNEITPGLLGATAGVAVVRDFQSVVSLTQLIRIYQRCPGRGRFADGKSSFTSIVSATGSVRGGFSITSPADRSVRHHRGGY